MSTTNQMTAKGVRRFGCVQASNAQISSGVNVPGVMYLFGEAIIRKYQGLEFLNLGTLSLILINAGVCIMISSKELSN